MTKVKVGDYVQITGTDSAHAHNIGSIVMVTRVDNLTGNISFSGGGWCAGSYVNGEYHHLKKVEKNMENLQQGDVLVSEGINYTRIVQGVLGEVVFTLDSDDGSLTTWTKKNIEIEGWKIKGADPEVQEFTLEQISEKLGVPVEQLRIKEKDNN